MIKQQKEFMAKVVDRTPGQTYQYIYILDSGRRYKGFWGDNGYNSIIVVGRTPDNRYERITEFSDVVHCYKCRNFNLDISAKDRMIRIWFDAPISFDDLVCSSCTVTVHERVAKI